MGRCHLLEFTGICLILLSRGFAAPDNVSNNVDDERKLHRILLEHYNKDIRPAGVDMPVEVKVGLSIVRLHSFDVKNEMFECHAWLRLAWKDVSLKWDPQFYGGVRYLTVAADKLWTPDIKLYNSVDHVDNVDPNLNALVYFDGSVAYIPRMTLRSHCNINKSIDGKPFNDQVCRLRFGSWVYDGLRVALSHFGGVDGGHVDLSDYIPKSKFEWFIRNATAVVNIKKYPCCIEPFPDITFSMNMHREVYDPNTGKTFEEVVASKRLESEIGVLNIAAVLLIPLLFLLPFESKAKTTLGCTALVCLTLILLQAPDDITAKLCELNIILVSVELVMIAVLLNIWHNAASHATLPAFLQKFVGVLAKVLCIWKPPTFGSDDQSELDDVADDSSLRVMNPKTAFDLYTWRTLVLIVDRLLFVMFFITAIIMNMSSH